MLWQGAPISFLSLTIFSYPILSYPASSLFSRTYSASSLFYRTLSSITLPPLSSISPHALLLTLPASYFFSFLVQVVEIALSSITFTARVNVESSSALELSCLKRITLDSATLSNSTLVVIPLLVALPQFSFKFSSELCIGGEW